MLTEVLTEVLSPPGQVQESFLPGALLEVLWDSWEVWRGMAKSNQFQLLIRVFIPISSQIPLSGARARAEGGLGWESPRLWGMGKLQRGSSSGVGTGRAVGWGPAEEGNPPSLLLLLLLELLSASRGGLGVLRAWKGSLEQAPCPRAGFVCQGRSSGLDLALDWFLLHPM